MIHISYRRLTVCYHTIQPHPSLHETGRRSLTDALHSRLDMVDIAIVNLTPSKLNKFKYMEYTFSLQIVPLSLEVHFLSCQKETFHMYLYKCCLSKFSLVKNILYAYVNIYILYTLCFMSLLLVQLS